MNDLAFQQTFSNGLAVTMTVHRDPKTNNLFMRSSRPDLGASILRDGLEVEYRAWADHVACVIWENSSDGERADDFLFGLFQISGENH